MGSPGRRSLIGDWERGSDMRWVLSTNPLETSSLLLPAGVLRGPPSVIWLHFSVLADSDRGLVL